MTQRKIANYLVQDRKAHYHFTVKNNQPGLFQDIALYFKDRNEPDFVLCDPPDHGRIEIRKIWTTTDLNDYLNFPHVGQAFVIQRESTDKKSGEYSCDIAYGITSRTLEQADPLKVLEIIGVIRSTKTAVIILSIGIMTRTEAELKPAMDRKLLLVYDALLLVLSS